jgi:uncharacterized protein
VSHETICPALYVQSRGDLERELTEHLRTRRRIRRPGNGNRQRASGRGNLVGMIHISERPPEAEDRALPGHWEGDLIRRVPPTSYPRGMLLRTLLLRLYRLPVRPVHLTPADLDLQADDVEFATVDGARLRGWFLPVNGADDGGAHPVVVVMHGWASAAEDLLPVAPAVIGASLSLLFVDARGHGRSDAAEFMSMPRFAEDLHAAVAWVRERPDVDAARIALVGHSVGAGAALLVASRDPRIAAVVSIASMADPREMIGRSFRRYRAPQALVRAVLRTIERTIGYRFDDFAPLHTIARIDAPVLVLHGLDDRTVPIDDAARLAESGSSATLRLVPGADHRSLDGFLPVLPEIVAHLRNALTQTPTDQDA